MRSRKASTVIDPHVDAPFHAQLQCAVCEVMVNFKRHTVWVTVPTMNVPDRGGAIAWAKSLDPDVWDIVFFLEDEVGEVPVSHYTRTVQRWDTIHYDRPTALSELRH